MTDESNISDLTDGFEKVSLREEITGEEISDPKILVFETFFSGNVGAIIGTATFDISAVYQIRSRMKYNQVYAHSLLTIDVPEEYKTRCNVCMSLHKLLHTCVSRKVFPHICAARV